MKKIKPGQIWSTSLEVKTFDGHTVRKVREEFHVMLSYVQGQERKRLENVIRVWPVRKLSHCSIQISREDFRIHTGFGNFLVEVWNERPMLAGNLGRFLGEAGQNRFQKAVEIRREFYSKKISSKSSTQVITWKREEMKTFHFLSEPAWDMLSWDDK